MKWDSHFTLAPEQLCGHSLKFKYTKCLHNVKIDSFSQRTVKYRNSSCEETLNQFKSKLNKENWNKKKFSSAQSIHTLQNREIIEENFTRGVTKASANMTARNPSIHYRTQ